MITITKWTRMVYAHYIFHTLFYPKKNPSSLFIKAAEILKPIYFTICISIWCYTYLQRKLIYESNQSIYSIL